jgi:hypothetical protein
MINECYYLIDLVVRGSESEDKLRWLTKEEDLQIDEILEKMEIFNATTIELQKEDIDLLVGRSHFNNLMIQFEEDPSIEAIEYYLSDGANIIHSPIFERAIVKILAGEALSRVEKEVVKSLKITSHVEVQVQEESELLSPADIAAKVTADAKKLSAQSSMKKMEGLYMNCTWIPCTSNIVERLFSRAKLYYSPHRMNLTPLHLEDQLFLFANKGFYSIWTLNRVYENDKN